MINYLILSILTAIMLLPENPVKGSGWKVPRQNVSFCGNEDLKKMEEMEECMKEYAYTFNETVIRCNKELEREFKVALGFGLVHIIKPANDSLKSNENPMQLFLNPKLNYFIAFIDPIFKIVSFNPSIYIMRKIHFNSGWNVINLQVYIAKISNE